MESGILQLLSILCDVNVVIRVGFISHGFREVRKTLSKDKIGFQDSVLLLGGFNRPLEVT